MNRLRQTGLAYLSIPTNENTRLPHCLGTTYWTTRFLAAMRKNEFCEVVGDGFEPLPGNRHRLDHLDAMLGPDLSLELLARLYALIHDSDLLPFGHTLSHQLGYYPAPGSIPRFQRYLARIHEEVGSSPLLMAVPDPADRASLLAGVRHHLAAVEAVATSVNLLAGRPAAHSSWSEAQVIAGLPVHTFVETLVTATVSTDLLDFSLRDTLGAGTPWNFDGELLSFVTLFAIPPTATEAELLARADVRQSDPLFRFGVNAVVDGHVEHRAVTSLVDLLRVRYDVLERIVYSSGKVAADAMLDRAIRNINAHHAGEPFDEADLLELGDDQFLDLLEVEEHKVNLPHGCEPAIGDLKARRLWREAYRIEDRGRLSAAGVALLREARDPSGRDAIEERLLQELPEVAATDVVVSCLPLTMQGKDPDVLVGWHGGDVLSLAELARSTGYCTEALAVTERYASLWSLSVFSRETAPDRLEAIRKAASIIFEN